MRSIRRSKIRGNRVGRLRLLCLAAGCFLAGRPPQVLGSAGVKTVSQGTCHSLAVEWSGTVLAWGQNTYGQLGQGTSDPNSHPAPKQVYGLSGVTGVAAGYGHSLALKLDWTVWAWGNNDSGQLGDGTTFKRTRPVQVSGLSGVRRVAAGGSHSLAVKSDATVWAWGSNGSGQLGDGTIIARHTPVQVPDLTEVVAVAGGGGHSLAVKSDGTLWAWGSNTYGQLGDGATISRCAPVQVSGLTGVMAVAAGRWHSLAVKSDGTVWTWGWNRYGQLGNGTADDDSHPTPMQVPDLTGVDSVAAGDYHSLAVKSDGMLWAWGRNWCGQVGDATIGGEKCVPVQVVGLTDMTDVAAGGDSSIAMEADGAVWAWGWNNYGQLGDGTTDMRYAPVAVSGLPVAPVVAKIPNASVPAPRAYTGPTPTLTQGTPPVTWSLVTGPAGMTINPTSGVVSWPESSATGSPFMIVINASNAAGSGGQSWRLTVMPPEDAPAIAEIPDATVQAPGAYTGPTPSLTKGALPVTWSLVAGPAGMTIDPATGVVSWPASTSVGSPFTITIAAANSSGSATRSWRLVVAPPVVPVIAAVPDASIQMPDAYIGPTPSLTQGTPPVTWSLVVGPSGMSIDPATGVVSWPTSTTMGSPFAITVAAANSAGSAIQTWHLTVTPAGNLLDSFILRILTTSGVPAPQPQEYDRGATVQIYAPDAPAGYRFTQWSGDASGTDNPLTVLMDRDKTITANYDQDDPSGQTAQPSAAGFCGAGLAEAMMVSGLGLALMRTRREHLL